MRYRDEKLGCVVVARKMQGERLTYDGVSRCSIGQDLLEEMANRERVEREP